MAMQTEAILFTAHVSTHTGVTTFLVPRGKDRSQEDVSLTPGVWRYAPLSSLAILETFLHGPKAQPPSFILERRTEAPLLQEMLERSGRVRSDPERESPIKNQVNSSLPNLARGHSSSFSCPGGLSKHLGVAETNRHRS